jgi:hypothetical protein
MATFSKIDGAEPSTVTFQLRTVTQDVGGVTQHQEIVTLGGSESTLAVAQVRAADPASSEWALAVRQVGLSTQALRVVQSTAADLNVTVAGYVAPSTTVNVSSIAGPVTVRSSAANALVSVYQSTAADLNVTVAGYVAPSTTIQVSSLAGAVITRSSAANMLVTAYQSSAADFNVTVAGYVAPSTTVAVSTVQGVVRIAGNNAVDGIVHVGDSTNAALRVNVVAGAAGGSTVMTLSRVQDSSNTGLAVGDSENNAIRVNVVAGAAGGSTIVTVSTGSVRVHQSSAADLNVTVAGYSTTVNISSLAGPVIIRSSAADALMTVYQSTAADLNVTVAGYSTTVNVSSLGGAVIVRSSAANALMTVYQSTAADLQATARITTSSGGSIGSTAPLPIYLANSTGRECIASTHYNTSNCQQLAPLVRPILPICNSTTIAITSTHSTAIYEIISSAAGLRHKVFAYFVGSTHTNPSTLIFCSSASASGLDHWHINFGSGSSGITGANMAMAPPGFIFAGVSQNALNVKIEGGSSVTSTVIARVSVAWFDEA